MKSTQQGKWPSILCASLQVMLGVALATVPACDSETGDDALTSTNEAGTLFPLTVGATWNYRTLVAGVESSTKTISIAAHPTDLAAVLYSDEEDDEGERSISTLSRAGTNIYRTHKDVMVAGVVSESVDYDPGFTRVDDAWTKAAVGSSETRMYRRTTTKNTTPALRTHIFRIIEQNVMVTVPAGSFVCTGVERVRLDGATQEDLTRMWFAPGIGKVRQEKPESGKVEELVAVTGLLP